MRKRTANMDRALFVLAVLLVSANATVVVDAQHQSTSKDRDWRVMASEADARARDIVSKMTLDEKIAQLHGIRDETHYRVVPGISRLDIPDFHITNGPAGAGPGDAGPQKPGTALPAPIALASAWDLELARRHGEIAASEARDLGNSLLESPDINIARLPQNGRTFEAYGEDPYLTGQLAVAYIEGVQSQGIMANVKHFAANNQEQDRFVVDEKIDERTLREIYFPAFEDSINKAHAASIMCAYPKLNGTFDCENDVLMNQILKKEWGFNGFVVSDFNAVHSTLESALAGLDLEMPTGKYWGTDLKPAIEGGRVPLDIIDDKLVRRFRTMMAFGVFDRPPQAKPLDAQKHGEVAREIAEAGIVLLKNEGALLPLIASRLKTIALIGPGAMKASTGGGGSSKVVPLYTVAPEAGLRSQAPRATIQVNDGSDIAAAAALAKSADAAIVMVGDADAEGRDQSLDLKGTQNELVSAVAAANPKTVVVLKTGSAVLMPWVAQVPAILEAWYPGEEDGNAVAAALFGSVNPSGKLPITFPQRIEDTPANAPEQYPGIDKVAHYSEGVFVGYRHYDGENIEPLFPFGHGLSYTKFAYSNLHVSPQRAAKNEFTVDVEVRNVGETAGAEVVQLYVHLPGGNNVSQPPKQLKGFQKVLLQPGKKTRVRFTLSGRALSYWDTASHSWKIEPGTYAVCVGSSSRDIRATGQFKISADTL
ncbi:MAG TPA: glycoside hydrolase family 3 C-terminal domain-containing protein [Candidatus Sulfotelmatobacter sp.]|nr:glycoside hydrolase family 3 C-terminal domain-containing protein [Candidatus Sulfotelmatobacter sp.]